MIDRAISWIEEHDAELLETLKTLARIPSVSADPEAAPRLRRSARRFATPWPALACTHRGPRISPARPPTPTATGWVPPGSRRSSLRPTTTSSRRTSVTLEDAAVRADDPRGPSPLWARGRRRQGGRGHPPCRHRSAPGHDRQAPLQREVHRRGGGGDRLGEPRRFPRRAQGAAARGHHRPHRHRQPRGRHPVLDLRLRGVCNVTVEVSGVEAPLHSGMWGGPVPDRCRRSSRSWPR